MIDKLFLDTNMVIDLLGEREPHYESVTRIATLADGGSLQLRVSALTYARVYYLLSRFEPYVLIKEKIRKFKAISGSHL